MSCRRAGRRLSRRPVIGSGACSRRAIARADLGERGRRERRPAAIRSGGTSPCCRRPPIGDLAPTVRDWRTEGARVVLASDQSARLSETPRRRRHRRRADRPVAEAPPTGGLALIERSLNGGFAGGPDGLVAGHRPRAVRLGPRAPAACAPPRRAARPAGAAATRRRRRPHRPRRGALRRPGPAAGRRCRGEERDFLELRFAARDRMWVPVEQIERVTRYAGGEDPQLSQPRRRRVAARQDARPQGRRGPRAGAARAVLGTRRRARPGVRRRHALAAGDGGGVPVRGDAGPAARGAGGQGGPGAAHADGPAGRRRRRLRQDRGRHPRPPSRPSRRGTQVAVLVPDDRARRAAPGHVQPAVRGLPDHRPDAQPVRAARRAARHARRAGRGVGGPRHRHASAAQQGRRVPDLGTRRRRRGAALRRRPQGAAQAAQDRGPRPDALGDAHPAHAEPGTRRRARHERHRDAAGGPAAHPDARRRGIGRARARRHRCASSTAAARSSTSTTGSRPSRHRPSSCGASCRGLGSSSPTGRWRRARWSG